MTNENDPVSTEAPGASQWRTVGLAAFGALLLVGCFVYAIWRATMGGKALDLGEVGHLYTSLADAVVFLVAIVGFKALGQYLGGGGGVRGAMKALWTSEKPEPPPGGQPPKPGGTP